MKIKNFMIPLVLTVLMCPLSVQAGGIPTALGEGGDHTTFCIARNRDLFCIIKRGTGTHSTEVHVLSADSNYKTFILQTGTALHETGDNVVLV